MNLNAYDNVVEKINKQKSWIDIKKKILLSRELNVRDYVLLTKRYDKSTNTTDYFVVMLDNPPVDREYKRTKVDDYGRCKISLAPIWGETYLCNVTSDFNISISLEESSYDGDIYKLNL